jgi:hypothetical protein
MRGLLVVASPGLEFRMNEREKQWKEVGEKEAAAVDDIGVRPSRRPLQIDGRAAIIRWRSLS